MKTTDKIRIGGHQFAYPHRIVKLVACENYTNILFDSGKKLMVATTLGKLQERLEPFGFCRPNRQTVVNMKCILKMEESESTCQLKLKNKEKLTISKRRLKEMRECFAYVY